MDMNTEKVQRAEDDLEGASAERVQSRSESVRPRLRIKLPSDELESRQSSSSARNVGDEEKAQPPETSECDSTSPGFSAALHARLDAFGFLPDTTWATKNFEFAKLKPVIRAAVAAWISLLFIIIFPLENVMGQVSGMPLY